MVTNADGARSAYTHASDTVSTVDHQLIVRFDSTVPAWNIYLDRGSNIRDAIAGTPAEHVMNDFFICGLNGGTVRFDGKISEIVFYDTAISDADMTSLQNYFLDKWGV